MSLNGTTRVLAWIRVLGQGSAEVHVPGQDTLTPGWPPNLDEVARGLSKSGSTGDYE